MCLLFKRTAGLCLLILSLSAPAIGQSGVQECVPKIIDEFRAERTVFDPLSEDGYLAQAYAIKEAVEKGLDFINRNPCPTGCTETLDEGDPSVYIYSVDAPTEYDDCVHRNGFFSARASATGPGCTIATMLLGSELMNGMNERLKNHCGSGCKADRWINRVSDVTTSSVLGICTASASNSGYISCIGDNSTLSGYWRIMAYFQIGRICTRPIVQDPTPSPSPTPQPTSSSNSDLDLGGRE